MLISPKGSAWGSRELVDSNMQRPLGLQEPALMKGGRKQGAEWTSGKARGQFKGTGATGDGREGEGGWRAESKGRPVLPYLGRQDLHLPLPGHADQLLG